MYFIFRDCLLIFFIAIITLMKQISYFQSFEKVLVQNIRIELSPSLTEAIEAIPRWRLIQAALPHVMHALAALLHNRYAKFLVKVSKVMSRS